MLRQYGLNLFAILDTHSIQRNTRLGAGELDRLMGAYPRLVLVGHGGTMFWRALQESGMNGNHPVDEFSRQILDRLVAEFLGSPAVVFLYPGDQPVPLQQIGALAGWHHPSPLGSGIHNEYGPWFSYRGAFLIDRKLPVITQAASVPPCTQCAHKPCIRMCPAKALDVSSPPDLVSCSTFRLAPDSGCELKCDARLACPVGSAHRYSDAQTQYHYRRSIESLRAYARGGETG